MTGSLSRMSLPEMVISEERPLSFVPTSVESCDVHVNSTQTKRKERNVEVIYELVGRKLCDLTVTKTHTTSDATVEEYYDAVISGS